MAEAKMGGGGGGGDLALEEFVKLLADEHQKPLQRCRHRETAVVIQALSDNTVADSRCRCCSDGSQRGMAFEKRCVEH